MEHRERALYRGGWFTISEFHCGGGSSPGPEEYSPLNSVVLVRSGAFLKQARGRETLADANQVLFFNRHEPYRVSHLRGLRDECFIVSSTTQALRQLMAVHDPAVADRCHPFRHSSVPCSTRSYARQQRLSTALRRGGLEPLAIEETTLELLDECVRPHRASRDAVAGQRAATRVHHRELTEAVKELLAGALGQRLSLHAIARAVGAAPFHLARLFRRETGLPIHVYRQRLRLRSALQRVADGERDLAALAVDLGFSDHSHLTRAFRAEYGAPPSAWRSRARNGQSGRIRLDLPDA